MCLCSPSSITWYLARAFMLMRRNVAAGIGSNEQGEYCRAALQRSDRKEPGYKWPTLLFFILCFKWWLFVQFSWGHIASDDIRNLQIKISCNSNKVENSARKLMVAWDHSTNWYLEKVVFWLFSYCRHLCKNTIHLNYWLKPGYVMLTPRQYFQSLQSANYAVLWTGGSW